MLTLTRIKRSIIKLAGIASISMYACFSTTTVTKNELTRFFDSPLDLKNERASFQRTSFIVLQSVFGLALILLSTHLHFNRHYSPYDVILTILCIVVTTRLLVVVVVWSNCVYRLAEKLEELRRFLDKCNGRTEYEHLALKMKDLTLCLVLLNKQVSTILLFATISTIYCLLLMLKNITTITTTFCITAPFWSLFLVSSYANLKLEKLKTASLRLFDLQFITPAINSLVNYFWMARIIEELPSLKVKFLFETTFSNAMRMLIYCVLIYISFDKCIHSALKCNKF